MKKLNDYVLESTNNNDKILSGIKFTIWETQNKKVTELSSNEEYQKIEYKYENIGSQLFIDFLLGFKDNTWKLWVGKIGALGYDDDPYCSLDTEDFNDAIIKSLDKITEFINDVIDDPENYVQYYKDD